MWNADGSRGGDLQTVTATAPACSNSSSSSKQASKQAAAAAAAASNQPADGYKYNL
jgi:hypothetical protein